MSRRLMPEAAICQFYTIIRRVWRMRGFNHIRKPFETPRTIIGTPLKRFEKEWGDEVLKDPPSIQLASMDICSMDLNSMENILFRPIPVTEEFFSFKFTITILRNPSK